MPDKNSFNLKKRLHMGILLAITTINAIHPTLTTTRPNLNHENTTHTGAGASQTAKEIISKTIDNLFFATTEAFTPEVSSSSGITYVTNEIIKGGTQTVTQGGSTGNIYINSNGVQDLINGGIAHHTQVNYYGIQYAHSGGIARDTAVYSHGEQIVDGGTATNAQIYDGGRQIVYNGQAYSTHIHSGGVQSIFIDGIVQDTHIHNGALQRIYEGGTASNTNIHSGGTQIVDYNGRATDMTVHNGGIQYVNSGGTAQGITINNGGLSILGHGATAQGTIHNQGILDASKYNGPDLSIDGNVGKIILYELGRSTQKQLNIENLSGLQTLVISADLLNNKADNTTINNANGTHYIKVLRELTDGSDLPYITGHSITIATITNGTNIDFQGAVSAIDGVNVKAIIQQNSNKWDLIGYQIIGPSNLSKTDIIGADMTYAALLSSQDNLRQRLDELRNNKHNGAWARIYGGEYAINANTMKYNTIQGGYDLINQQPNGKSVTGLTIEHLTANNNYTTGHGKLHNTLFGIHHTWINNSGHYYDIIAKTGRLHNEITVYDEENIKGNYHTNNLITSATYGYRHTMAHGYYINPQIAIQYGKINAVNYTTDSRTLVRQDAINSLISKLGLTIGRTTTNHDLYISANWLHEFTAKSKVATGRTKNAYTLEDDFRGNYLELSLGGNITINRNNLLYLDTARSFGGKLINKWRLQAGYKHNF